MSNNEFEHLCSRLLALPDSWGGDASILDGSDFNNFVVGVNNRTLRNTGGLGGGAGLDGGAGRGGGAGESTSSRRRRRLPILPRPPLP